MKALDEFKKTGNIGDTLTRAYEDSLRRIQCQPEEHRELARKILTCVTFSFKPLAMDEVRRGIAVDENSENIDPEYDLDDPDLMISVCAGLVTVDMQSQVIRIVHYTTQTFLESLDNGFLSSPHTVLASCCLSYLQLSLYATGHLDDISPPLTRWREFPFHAYSAEFWATHWERGGYDQSLQKQVFSFLDNFGFVASAWETLQIVNPGMLQDNSHGISALHLLASMGTTAVLKTYLDRVSSAGSMQNGDIFCEECKRITSSHIDFLESRQSSWQEAITSLKDSDGMPALFYAAQGGHLSTMEALHHANKNMLNETDCNGSTALMHALRARKYSIVLGLLQKPEALRSEYKIKINFQDKSGQSALSVAAMTPNLELVKLLTSTYQADVDSVDRTGNTPIMWAARCIRMDIVIFLAPFVSDINQRDHLGRTVSHHLLRGVGLLFTGLPKKILNGLSACLTWLVEYGADLHLENPRGISAHGILCKLEVEATDQRWEAEQLDVVRQLKEIALSSPSPDGTCECASRCRKWDGRGG